MVRGVRDIGLVDIVMELFGKPDPTWRDATPEKTATIQMIQNGMLDDYPGYVRLSDNADVQIAVNKIADLVSSMTIHLIQNTEEGDQRVRNGLARKLDVEPCANMTRKTWLTRIVRDMLLYGEGNSIIRVDIDRSTGNIENLVPLDMRLVSIEPVDELNYKVHYGNEMYTNDEIMHFAINPDPHYPYKGTGYQVLLRDIVDNLSQANKTRSSFMKGKYMPSLIVKVDSLSEELTSEKGKQGVRDKFLTSSGAGEPWIIPAELLEVQQVKPLSLQDIAINESAELDKRTVAGIFGVPAYFLGVGKFTKVEYNNFINTRVMSIAQTIAQTLTRDLLYSEDLYIRLNPRSLYAYDITEMVSAGGRMVQMNAMRRNELRDWVGLDPDAEMEELIVLENYVPAEQLGDQGKLQGGDDEK